jgi:hypothetical protein
MEARLKADVLREAASHGGKLLVAREVMGSDEGESSIVDNFVPIAGEIIFMSINWSPLHPHTLYPASSDSLCGFWISCCRLPRVWPSFQSPVDLGIHFAVNRDRPICRAAPSYLKTSTKITV